MQRESEMLEILSMIQGDMQDNGWCLNSSKEFAWSEMQEYLRESGQCLKSVRQKYFNE